MHVKNKVFVGIIGATLLSATALWEGTKYYAYRDMANIPTVCSGYTGKDIVFGRKYSQEECNAFLRKELNKHAEGVLECIQKPLKENEYNAFTLMAYNVGVGAFCSSRAVKLFNEGKNTEACKAMAYSPTGKPAWSYVDGKFVRGLHNRRIYEMNMCLGGKNG